MEFFIAKRSRKWYDVVWLYKFVLFNNTNMVGSNMKDRFIEFYMDFAKRTSKLSYAKKLKVGAVIVKDTNILSYGYNGTLAGLSNECEDEYGNTKPDVIHAEENAILKLAKEGKSGNGATIFCTHSPCITCARMIASVGINKVYYLYDYRSTEGIELLKLKGIDSECVSLSHIL